MSSKPTISQIREYGLSLGYAIDAEAFYSWYEVKGWTDNWKSAVVSWHRQSKISDEPRYQEVPKEPENERRDRCIRRGLCPVCYGMITEKWDDGKKRCESCMHVFQ